MRLAAVTPYLGQARGSCLFLSARGAEVGDPDAAGVAFPAPAQEEELVQSSGAGPA